MEQKSLVQNSFFFVLYKFVSVLFPLITITYVSHIILADGVGKVSSAQNIVQYFVLIAGLGIPNYGTRECAKIRDDKYGVSKLFSELFIINFFSTSICTIAYYILINMLDIAQRDFLLYNIIGLTVIFNYFNVDWFYQGFEEFKYITILSTILKILSLLCLFLFVKEKEDYVVYAAVNLIGVAGNNCINFIRLRRYRIRFKTKNLNLKRHLKPILILFSTVVAIELYTLVDTTMLSFLCKSENVAFYTNSIRIVRTIIIFVTSIGGVLLPRLSYYNSLGMQDECNRVVNNVLSFMIFLLAPCGIGLFLMSDSVVLIFLGDSFSDSIYTLQLASFLLYALGLSNLFGTQILITYGSEKKLFKATIIGASSNLILNILLIPYYQQNGAVIASIISELLVSMLTFYYARQYIKFEIDKRVLFSITFGLLLMTIAIILLRITMKVNSISFILTSIVIASGIYYYSNMKLNNPALINLNLVIGRFYRKYVRKINE